MAPGKRQRPLFELLASKGPPPSPAPRPGHREPPRREPPPPHEQARQPDGLSERHEPVAQPDSVPRPGDRRRVTVALPTLYTAAMLVLVLLIAAYAVGYSIGRAGGEAEVEEADLAQNPLDLGLEDVRLADQPPVSTPIETPAPAPTQRQRPRPAPPDNQPSASAPVLLGPDGPLGQDPRVVGMNYLELAVLDRPAADAALGILGEGGVRGLAVRVDPGATGGNTSARYRLVALDLAVPGGRFQASAPDRERYEARIRRIGRQWVEAGGASDFADPLWRRHDG